MTYCCLRKIKIHIILIINNCTTDFLVCNTWHLQTRGSATLQLQCISANKKGSEYTGENVFERREVDHRRQIQD